MKIRLNIIFTCILLLLSPVAISDDAIKNVEKKANSFIGQSLFEFLEGQGTTEIEVSGVENKKPEISIMLVRPLSIDNQSAFFTQLQLNNYYVQSKDRLALNLGFGYRRLFDDNNYFLGANIFIDTDDEENLRTSAGFEFKSSALQSNINLYKAITGSNTVSGDKVERVLDGYDINILGEVPYFHWAKLNYNYFYWEKDKNSRNTYGERLFLEMLVHENIVVEVGFEHDNLSKQIDLLNIQYIYPGIKGKTMFDNFIADTAFSKGDVSEFLLQKVERSNRIAVETAAEGVVIGRLD